MFLRASPESRIETSRAYIRRRAKIPLRFRRRGEPSRAAFRRVNSIGAVHTLHAAKPLLLSLIRAANFRRCRKKSKALFPSFPTTATA